MASGVGKWVKGGVGSSTEPESRKRLGGLHECVEAGRGAWWSAGWQAQVRENFDDHRGIFDGSNNRQGAAALRTGGSDNAFLHRLS